MKYPTIAEVEVATALELCCWYWQLPSPGNSQEEAAWSRIIERVLILDEEWDAD